MFEAPHWFILIPALLFLGWFWESTAILRPLRITIILLATLLLANPKTNRQQNALDLYVLLDRSKSTEGLVDKNLAGWTQLLEDARPSRADRLQFINYASDITPQGSDETAIYTGSRDLTKTNLALQTTLASVDDDRPSRILILTDGFSTEPLNDLAEKLEEQGVPLDYRIIRESVSGDYRLSRLDIPERSQLGEPFVIAVHARGHKDGPQPLQVFRNTSLITETTIEIVNGVGRIEFTDRLGTAGAYNYRARIIPEEDAHEGNNELSQFIEIVGGPRVLLITNYSEDPLARALTAQGFTVDTISNPSSARPGQLAGAKACILNNVAASQLPDGFLDAVSFFVQEQAGGLLMVGGKNAFGAGGYHNSAIDELLPVSMELKNEHRKLSLAMAIVMDRSGSMQARVAAPGGAMLTKMELANTGAANAIQLLGVEDSISVIAVDSDPHVIIPMTRVGGKKDGLQRKARSVKSSGGGIYVYTGLSAAWKELKKARHGTKHIILFSDAADSEEPGRYKELLEEMANANCTVSVIGLGNPTDPDAQFLEDIAKRGGGRMFFTSRPEEVPRIFAQETVAIARSAFITDPVNVQPTGQWSEISPVEIPWLTEVDGYNLSYLRPEAAIDLASVDEYAAPLLAHVQRGFGRTMAVSFPLGGDYSERARSWDSYGDFAQTFTRWLMGLELPPGIGLKHKLEGTRLTVDLLYDTEQWAESLSKNPPTVKILEDTSGVYEATWKRLAPGHFTLTKDLPEGTVIRGSVQVGPHALPFGPLTVGSSAEWTFDPTRTNDLRVLSAQTNGRELLDLSKAWLRPAITRETDYKILLISLLVALVLLDALITRIGWPLFRSSGASHEPADAATEAVVRNRPQPGSPSKTKPFTESKSSPAVTPKPSAQPTETSEPDAFKSRFDRAKRKK